MDTQNSDNSGDDKTYVNNQDSSSNIPPYVGYNGFKNNNTYTNPDNTTPYIDPAYMNFYSMEYLNYENMKRHMQMDNKMNQIEKKINMLDDHYGIIKDKISVLTKLQEVQQRENNVQQRENSMMWRNNQRNRYRRFKRNLKNKKKDVETIEFHNPLMNLSKDMIFGDISKDGNPFTNIFKSLVGSSNNDKNPKFSFISMDNDNSKKTDNGFNPFGFLETIFSSLKKNNTPEEESDNSEEEEFIEYNSDDEYEEIDTNIKNIDDIIKLGDLYEKLVNEKKEEEAKQDKLDEQDNKDDDDIKDIRENAEKIMSSMLNKNGTLNMEKMNKQFEDLKLNNDTKLPSSFGDMVLKMLNMGMDTTKCNACKNDNKNKQPAYYELIEVENPSTNDKKATSTNDKKATSTNEKKDASTNDKKDINTNEKKDTSTNKKKDINTNKKKNINTNEKKDINTNDKEDINKNNKKDKNKKPVYELNGKKYSINLELLNKLKKPLLKLKAMIGLEKIKASIVDMILYYLQNFEKKNNNLLHTAIEGDPGVGKTELAKIIAEIYANMGVIKDSTVITAKRTDLIGEYVGHTAHKTQNMINKATNRVLFIDEAYALGGDGKRENSSYSKECIDTLNMNLTERRSKFICIIAGYPGELENCFFSYNPGLKRRFPFRFHIEGYNHEELRDIFMKKLDDISFKIDSQFHKDQLTEFFKENYKLFKNYGGDIENLITYCKFMHAKRIFGKHPKYRRRLTKEDLVKALDKFISSKKNKENGALSYYL